MIKEKSTKKTTAIWVLSIFLVLSLLYNVGTNAEWEDVYYDLYDECLEDQIVYKEYIYEINPGEIFYASYDGSITGSRADESLCYWVESDAVYSGECG